MSRVLLIGFLGLLLTAPSLCWGLFGRFRSAEPKLEEERNLAAWRASDVAFMEGARFRFAYPKTWHLATEQPDYDPDRLVTVQTAGESFITIEVFDPKTRPDLSVILGNVRQTYDGVIVTTMSRTRFQSWGEVQGDGIHLVGKILGLYPGGCRIFVGTYEQIGMIVTEYYFSEELNEALQGYTLIGQTFSLK